VEEIEDVIATMARIPPKTVSKSDRSSANLDAICARRVRPGQAIDAADRGDQAGARRLREPDKPIGSYLFSGPTGVGKTEVAKQLAAIAGRGAAALRHVRIHGAHTVSRLIGAPPGYVGFDQGGLLTDGVDSIRTACCCSTRSRRRIRTCSTSCCR
jgi:ATP-dependent Clp protease ATP-binding subunit ClpA